MPIQEHANFINPIKQFPGRGKRWAVFNARINVHKLHGLYAQNTMPASRFYENVGDSHQNIHCLPQSVLATSFYMYKRLLDPDIAERQTVFLWGPCQAGKTT
jgi:hypothetical protein